MNKNFTTIEATYRIVTPMFCSGAQSRKKPELRAASFKGVMRFWWRALNWGRIFIECNENLEKAKHKISEQEAAIFGSSTSGQAVFSLQIQWLDRTPKTVEDWPPNNAMGSGYLGYGITKSKEEEHQVGFREGCDFKVTCTFNEKTIQGNQKEILKILQLIGLVGAMGSRARRGFGTVSALEIDGDKWEVKSKDEFMTRIGKIVSDESRKTAPTPFTAFSGNSRVAFLDKEADARKAHQVMGECYRNFRGQPGSLRGREKIPFGLPLAGVDTVNRRASPIFMRIQPIGNSYHGMILFLPSVFHPEYDGTSDTEFYSEIEKWMKKLGAKNI